jgi:uroporphyrinogen decarboxylase
MERMRMAGKQDLFLRACRGEQTDITPVWFMRQAGRYQPEYRALREQHGMLEIVATPELAAQVTLMPVQSMEVDAAILFSDIMVPLAPMGVDFDIEKDVGPVIANPIQSVQDVRALRPFDVQEALPHVLETIRIVKSELSVPLIGFAGAPFTLASYLVEGRAPRRRDYRKTKMMMYREPELWLSLLNRLADMAAEYLCAQVRAGADAVQIFDSWVGCLSLADYTRYVLPAMRRLLGGLQDLREPVILFGVETGELLGAFADLGVDVVGVDWRVPLQEAVRRTGARVALQGNLDPALLAAPPAVLRAQAEAIVRAGRSAPGHIFNLGHGVAPDTDPDVLKELVQIVHRSSAVSAQS